jgi:serine protease AprX
MSKIKKFILSLVVLLTITGLVGGMLIPVPARSASIQPELRQLAKETPDQTIRLVVQKTDLSDKALVLAKRLGGDVISELAILNAFVVEMPTENVVSLALSSNVAWVSLDGQISASGYIIDDDFFAQNYYRGTTKAETFQAKTGLYGDGIGVAVIDSGVDESHGCLNVAAAPFGTGDAYGHGTHVAGIIACNDHDYKGIAPNVNLISLKVFDTSGLAYESDIVAALEWIYNNKDAYNIRVVNMSFNATLESSYHESFLNAAAEILWFNGIVVVTSVGNKGPAGGYNTTKTAPANDPFFIAVGAADEHENSDPSNDTYAPFSSAGLTLDGHAKPDIVTPGYNIISALSTQSDWGDEYPDRVVDKYYDQYIRLSGTSMAAPVISGGIAVLLQYKPDLTPDQVKYIMTNYSGLIYKDKEGFPYLDVYGIAGYLMSLKRKDVVPSANTGEYMNMLLFTGDTETYDPSVSWNSVAWNSVAWNSVAWNSVAWNSVAWNSVAWNSVELNGVFWGPTRGPNK